ncbi:MAG TPA: ABC transporter permease [Terriglobales bacterium]|jgi:ABC-2 type transport system permease protein|nr:ABC transporter permease [Terriglobales bacterium]
MLAIVERELRKFFRSPWLMMAAMVLPLIQLIVLGNAFGGKIRDARLGVVDYDHGTESVKIQEAFKAVQVNVKTFEPVSYPDERSAMEDVRNGKIDGAIVIPAQFSRRVYAQEQPQIALVVDNTDNFMSSSLEDKLGEMVDALNQPGALDPGKQEPGFAGPPIPQPRILQQIALEIVELYPYVEYMKYLLPGSISLAMFVSVMIGGGIIYIDDKARGVHEGYLVTPITKGELVMGLNLAGALKAMMAGVVITVIGGLLSGVSSIFDPRVLLELLILIAFTSVAFIAMMSLLMVRVEDPLVPRATFGILNTLLFFPSGAIYPVKAFPTWLKWIAWIDPFHYAVHGFKALLLKDAGLLAIWPDLLFLGVFGALMLAGATKLFKRTL